MKNNLGVLAILLVILAFVVGGISAYVLFHQDQVVKEKIVMVNNSVITEVPYNDSAIKSDIAAVKSEVLKDSDFKTVAITMAEDKMNEELRHDIYHFLQDSNLSVDDKDTVKVSIIKKSSASVDTDNKDATVTETVRLAYETSDGDNKKVNIVVKTEIVDGDVDNQTYELD